MNVVQVLNRGSVPRISTVFDTPLLSRAESVSSTISTNSTQSTASKKRRTGTRKDKSPGITFDASFTPGPFDVICGRGNDAWNHRGNQFLRTLIQHGKKKYGLAGTKQQRSDVVSAIVETIRSKGHGFVKMDNTNHRWYEIGDYLSREKVSQLLRNANSKVYRSSAQAKKQRRKESNSRVFCSSYQLLRSDVYVSQIMDAVETELEESKDLSDDEILALFNQSNSQLLELFKKDTSLLAKFHAAEISQRGAAEVEGVVERDTVEPSLSLSAETCPMPMVE